METVNSGIQQALNGATTTKSVSTVSTVSTTSVDSDKTVEVEVRHDQDTVDSHESTASHQASLHRVVDITHSIHKHVTRLDEYDDAFIQGMDLPSYLEYVDDERLFHMPRRGSNWDRVLRSAQFFGLQLWSFGDKIGPSSGEVKKASVTALASCRVLLDV